MIRFFTTCTLPGSWNHVTVGGGVNWQSASHAPVDGPDGPQTVNQSSVMLVSAMAKYAFEYSNLYYAAPHTVTLTFNYRFL